ncbi:hypothetical protein C5S39_05560 [Candidatus Methanophagaceae archaeon]|nr:hypothetical protein C5S39_05560 [Methanophagales archaeon]
MEQQLGRPEVLQRKILEFEKNLERVMINLRDYAKEHEYQILVLLLRKGYAFVNHEEIYKRLKEYGLKICSDDEFKNEIRIKVKTDKTKPELKDWRIILFDDAIDDGENIVKLLEDVSNIISKDFVKDSIKRGNIKIGAYVINESNIEERKKIEEEWGKGIICNEIIGYEKPKKEFLEEVLNIMDYLAHIGEIIDPDHLIITGDLKDPLSYETIREALEDICNRIPGSEVYEADIRYYHPSRKKMGIYGLPCQEWIGEDAEKIGVDKSIFQCKIRFIFFLNEDATTEKFQIIPIVNPKIVEGTIGDCNHAGLGIRFCEICRKNIKNNNVNIEDIYANICLDCVLSEVTIRILSKFIDEYFSEVFKSELMKLNYSWKYLEKKYKRTDIPQLVKERLSILCSVRTNV